MFKDYGRGPAAVKVFFERVQNWVPISADSRRTREHAAAPPLREAGEESAYSDPENQPRRHHIEDAVADGWGAQGNRSAKMPAATVFAASATGST